METCEEQIGLPFEDELTCFQPAYPASQAPSPGSEEAKRMTVGSGRQCSMWLNVSDRLGAFSKILLGSLAWTNSEEYCYVWNRLDTRFALSAFQLTPLGQSTEGNGCSLLPTPNCKDHMQARSEEALERARTKGGCSNLKDIRLWRTPTAADSIGIKSQEALDYEYDVTHRGIEPNKLTDQLAVRAGMRLWRTPNERDWKETSSGATKLDQGHQMNLGDQAKAPTLWPTPTVPNGGRRNPEGTSITGKKPDGSKAQIDLREYAIRMFPTPTVQCGKNNAGPSQFNRNSDPLDVAAAKLSGELSGSLNPHFVEQLQGFPIDHTALKR